MRKTTMSLALGLALSFGAVGVASAQSTQPPRDRGAQQQGDRERRGPGAGRRDPSALLLKGITLTPDQQKRLDAIRAEQRTQMEATRDQFQKSMSEARDARERGDTATARTKMQALRAEMDQRREREFATIRGLLTSEQQKQFDANVAEMKQHAQERQRQGGDREGRGGQRPGVDSQRSGWSR